MYTLWTTSDGDAPGRGKARHGRNVDYVLLRSTLGTNMYRTVYLHFRKYLPSHKHLNPDTGRSNGLVLSLFYCCDTSIRLIFLRGRPALIFYLTSDATLKIKMSLGCRKLTQLNKYIPVSINSLCRDLIWSLGKVLFYYCYCRYIRVRSLTSQIRCVTKSIHTYLVHDII